MSLPKYLINKAPLIGKKSQPIKLWSAEVIKRYLVDELETGKPAPVKNPVLEDLLNWLKPETLQREEVVELYRKDLYLGYLATLLWGGLETAVNRNKKYFVRAINHPENKVCKTLTHIESMLRQDKVTQLFEDLQRDGPHKIPGLDYPYFTKLFYFIGQTMHPSPPQIPLIFDKWLKNAYCALSIQASKADIKEFYPRIKTPAKGTDRAGEIQCTSGHNLAKLYENYLRDFGEWSKSLGVSPEQLEEFVFGLELRSSKNRQDDNPRIALWKIIEGYYLEEISDQRLASQKKEARIISAVKKEKEYKYKPLEDYLAKCSGDSEVYLSIAEISELLKSPVPNWAFDHRRNFWGNNEHHTQKKAWMNNGFKVDTSGLDWQKKSGKVRFYKS